MKTQIVDKRSGYVVYMYEMYDVQAFFPSKASMERNYLTILRNTMVYALNNNEKLPKHLVIVLDNNFVKLAPTADITIKWIVTEIWRAVAARFEFLPCRALDMMGSDEYIKDRHKINHYLETKKHVISSL